jgi:hypothetical protein
MDQKRSLFVECSDSFVFSSRNVAAAMMMMMMHGDDDAFGDENRKQNTRLALRNTRSARYESSLLRSLPTKEMMRFFRPCA